jgi:nucleotide-binding universal stress UspA family protein
MLKRILVPLDGSPLAEAVLPQVKELAAFRKAEVVLLRVALAHTLPGVNAVDAQVHAVDEAQTYLAALEPDLIAHGLTVKSVVRYGHAAEEILDHARAGDVDLIAMSTHGRSGIRRWVVGSVAETVLRHAPVPVLLVRLTGPLPVHAAGRPAEVTTPRLPDASPAAPIRHILCPVDLTPACREVMATADAMAVRFGAELTILHAVYDPLDATCSHIPHPPMEQLREEMIQVADATLRRQARRALGPSHRASLVVVAGSPLQQILRFVRTHGVDLIVMGTEGKTGLDHMIMGSTAERVVRTAPCPVLSIRAAA